MEGWPSHYGGHHYCSYCKAHMDSGLTNGVVKQNAEILDKGDICITEVVPARVNLTRLFHI